jgi:phosphoheptose isomerase
MPHKYLNLREVRTYPLSQRTNLVSMEDLIHPGEVTQTLDSEGLVMLAETVKKAHENGKSVVWMIGAHVIKSGLGLLIIDLMKKGFITHIAGNGAVGIHDFELALIGETSEDVASSIEDGTFGMAEETGAFMHRALREGTKNHLGYGESLGRYILAHEFPYRKVSVLYNAYKLNIPFTMHVTLGADIIHQHPDCDFGILGATSGHDFKIFCHSISNLDQGVFLNFGSAVTGPEVFLKALSIARNLGHKVEGFTTANFDLKPLPENYHQPASPDTPLYYYRPLKNIINRPTSLSGQGYHIQGDHRMTIPTLYQYLTQNYKIQPNAGHSSKPREIRKSPDLIKSLTESRPDIAEIVESLTRKKPELKPTISSLWQAYSSISQSFERGGTLFLFGNGGSMADALHISGELQKSFLMKRPLSEPLKKRLDNFEGANTLSTHLEAGLPAYNLGLNPALTSAIDNDFDHRWLNIAQELQVLAKTGDVFFCISTSGKAKNILYACYTARAMGLMVILLTGENETPLSRLADITIHAPGIDTHIIQEAHIALYHCLCAMLERAFFRE